MNKKLMAVAVAGALAAPALAYAQSASNVQVYGRAQLTLANVKTTDATSGVNIRSRNRVDDNSSRIGFRGEERLSPDLRAIFRIESGVNMDTGDNSRNTGPFASREGWVGLRSNSMGQLTIGKQNVWWTNFTDQTQANYINHGLQYNTGGNGGGLAAPAVRLNNDIKYTTPNWNGFRGYLNYAPNSEAAVGGADTDGKVLGVSASYLTKTILAEFHWAENEAAGPSPATRTGTKLGLGWAYNPGAIISLNLIRLEDENVVGTSTRKVNSWQLNWSHMMGNWQWMAQLGASGDRSGASDTGSKGWLLAAKYHFSKRTGAYISYTKVDNESGANYDYNGGGNAVGVNTAGVGVGADPSIFGIGIQHNF